MVLFADKPHRKKDPSMRPSRTQIQTRCHALPEIRFEAQQLTSFSGVVLLQALFSRLSLRERLARCFPKSDGRRAYHPHGIVLWLILHLFIGFRRLRDRDFYHDDPIVQRALGWSQIPDVSTLSRTLCSVSHDSVEGLRDLLRQMALDRACESSLPRITIDFDGSVQSTQGHAEGTAVGYNKQKKGRRSYYPLFATLAQTHQFLDLLHRSGNVHDSRDARAFMGSCFQHVRAACPHAKLEARVDAAFFDQKILFSLDDQGIEFTASVPFERLVALKQIIEARLRWRMLDDEWSYFERRWKPKSWSRPMRFVFLRRRVKRQQKEPIQLDLFEPVEYTHRYTVIVTNKSIRAGKLMRFHHGRGTQEGLFADAKSSAQLGYLPVRSRNGNQTYTIASMLAHNLARELQINAYERDRGATQRRAPHWTFESLGRFRHRIIQRAGRLTHPAGKLTLTLNANDAIRDEFMHLLQAQKTAA